MGDSIPRRRFIVGAATAALGLSVVQVVPADADDICTSAFVCAVIDECDILVICGVDECHLLRTVTWCSVSYPEIICEYDTVDLGPADCC